MHPGNYVAPVLVVDTVIFQLNAGRLEVLLIRRATEPFKDMWALPGGYCSAGETTRTAMDRIVSEKAGVRVTNIKLVEQLYTFDTVARDPRGHAVSVTYMGLGRHIEPDATDAQNPTFFPVTDLPELAYDHADIITYAHERLKSKLSYTNAIYGLMAETFTLTHLQSAYEAVLCRPLDKRNFRKKFLSLDLVSPTDEMLQEGPHRPARLYRFNSTGLQDLERNFD